MDTWLDLHYRQVTNRSATVLQEQCLYDHLLDCVKQESPDELLARFRSLFINGVSYTDPQVWQALRSIVASPQAEKEFKFILNRSCHIFINHWLMQPRLHCAIPALIHLFDEIPFGGRSPTTRRLRELVRRFLETEQYLALRRLAQVVGQAPDWSQASGSKPLGLLIQRYPCLYEYNLLTEDSTSEQRRRVRQIRRQMQQQFDCDLSRYATYQRLNIGLSDKVPSPCPSALPVNPTLLSDRQLDHALQQFGGKVDGSNTYRDLAQCFITYSSQARCYRHFKGDLYEYLTASIDSKYGKTQFNQRLYTYIQDLLPDHDAQRLNDVLLVGTCRKLLNFLVVESSDQLNHAVFVDLTGNLGISTTIGLLLKIILVCRSVKPYLEKRFAILFKHYEPCARDGVSWLVESLEHLNIALSINFGTLNL